MSFIVGTRGQGNDRDLSIGGARLDLHVDLEVTGLHDHADAVVGLDPDGTRLGKPWPVRNLQ